ncbi:putative membrane protein [Halorhabdus sp. SVX81]|uniref:hypothetical protein n=1 Tax=Halorhabdus sp. SVX81 TaxID=2978283 RepID=UPI0023D9926B|nr:hypothetical protein [Halorhabdus sp. SVX81]WEL18148.1 putative membrane protein [Halorhabdus sp. SVX81]
MSLKQYVSSDQPLAASLRIAPRILFLTGCTFGILTALLNPVYGGLPIGKFGAGSFALGLSINAGNRLSEKQYFRPVLALIVAAGLGTIATGAVGAITPASAALVLTGVYFFWILTLSITGTGINTDEDPVKGGAVAGQGSGLTGSTDDGGH